MFIDYKLLKDIEALGQYHLLQTIIVSIGRTIINGEPVVVTGDGQALTDVMLTNFSDYTCWLEDNYVELMKR
ncbi:hypothetical protein LJ707_17650 [Mucilaginibacter sp. UR6-1]|uniref:hypothetical protein n=1 Tax=Mucilaginibacter sp. UR6-1 TaxID=1435643 RepID=UPI001E2C6E3E|nr:hypothetical protein [Mucilaginibacter sp. UR6-1]MCC8410771.1 hypothetical protein [Mucilaginibacter sp. UR6-1]